jgi:hypothetical protein
MPLRLLFPTVKTAVLCLFPMKSYSKNAHDHLSLKWTLVTSITEIYSGVGMFTTIIAIRFPTECTNHVNVSDQSCRAYY